MPENHLKQRQIMNINAGRRENPDVGAYASMRVRCHLVGVSFSVRYDTRGNLGAIQQK